MGEVLKVIEAANSYVGVREGSAAYDDLIKTFESSGYKYDGQGCTEIALAFIIKALGLKRAKQICPMSNYANALAGKFKELSKKPQAGALAFYDWHDGNGIQHVEIVTGITDRSINTVDGNSYHQIIKRERLFSNKYIAGYGVPDYKEDKDLLQMEFLNACIETIKIKYDDKGRLVLWAQNYLQDHGYYLNGKLDGWFHDYMLTEVKRWQADHGLYVDGVIAKFCLTYMLK